VGVAGTAGRESDQIKCSLPDIKALLIFNSQFV